MARLGSLSLVLLLLLAACGSASQATTKTPTTSPRSTVTTPSGSLVLKPVLKGYDLPVYLTNAGDGSGRLFIVEKPGKIQVAAADGTKQSQPFLDISALVSIGNERGLLSMAFDPHYTQNGYFYVDYTDKQGTVTLARYHVSSDPSRADPASAQIVLAIPHPVANHNGGLLLFGKDGYLYMGVGDGGAGNSANGQRKDILLGKILRLDVEHPSGSQLYSIPSDNPYRSEAGTRPEIWAYGLRNPWRFSFDQANGDLYIGDVGEGALEEIDVQPASSKGGENYGWNVWEGTNCSQSQSECNLPHLVAPVLTYPHGTSECAVTGGYVYRGQKYPSLQGTYFYGDYCSGRLWSEKVPLASGNPPKQTLQTFYHISSFGESEDGELYLVDLDGAIAQITLS